MSGCPSPEVLASIAEGGQVDPHTEQHVRECARCTRFGEKARHRWRVDLLSLPASRDFAFDGAQADVQARIGQRDARDNQI